MSKAAKQSPIDVWVIEDNESLRKTVARVLGRQKDMNCSHQFDRCEDAFTVLLEGERPQVILLDLGLPGMSGVEGIKRIKASLPEIEILVFSVFDDNDRVFNAICAGASKTSCSALTTRVPPSGFSSSIFAAPAATSAAALAV